MIVTDRNTNWQVVDSTGQADCPFCGVSMAQTDTGFECLETCCPYTQSQDIRNVVASLQEANYEVEVIAEIVNNISIDAADGDQNASLFIDSREKVEWALKKLAGYEQYIADVVSVANAEMERIQARVTDMLKSPKRERAQFAAFAEPQIEKFARADMAVLKKQSAKFIYGTVKITKTHEKLEIEDKQGLCELLIDLKHPELVREKLELEMTPLKETYDSLENMAKAYIKVIPAGENIKITPLLPLAEGR